MYSRQYAIVLVDDAKDGVYEADPPIIRFERTQPISSFMQKSTVVFQGSSEIFSECYSSVMAARNTGGSKMNSYKIAMRAGLETNRSARQIIGSIIGAKAYDKNLKETKITELVTDSKFAKEDEWQSVWKKPKNVTYYYKLSMSALGYRLSHLILSYAILHKHKIKLDNLKETTEQTKKTQ